MKIKKVNQYKCDHCGKKKYNAASMIKHEKHCTKNPDRYCRMCDIVNGAQNNLKSLIAIMPCDVIETNTIFENIQEKNVLNIKEILSSFEKMKEEANCPACILAVIRQLKSKVFFNFDYKEEVKQAFEDTKPKINYSCLDFY